MVVFKEINDLEMLKVKYNEQNLSLILLCSLLTLYMYFGNTILYSCDALTIEKVSNAQYSKEKMKHLVECMFMKMVSLFMVVMLGVNLSLISNFVIIARRKGT